MKTLHLICVGKNKNRHYLELESDYLKRIKSFHLKIHEVKSHEENLEIEAQEVAKKIHSLSKNKPLPFYLLTEKGASFHSKSFSLFIKKQLEIALECAFIIGGASGHGKELYKSCKGEISLSTLTFPHKMARLLFIEQIYRAETIIQGHPYNK